MASLVKRLLFVNHLKQAMIYMAWLPNTLYIKNTLKRMQTGKIICIIFKKFGQMTYIFIFVVDFNDFNDLFSL